MSWIKDIGVMLASVLVALFIAEGVLWASGSYTELANSDLEPSNTVWTRPPGVRELKRHPDLKHRVSIVYDDFGVRNHSGKSLHDFTRPVGVFGDSFTENRRIEDKYSVTALLNELWGESRAINFGIDGFGLEQSIQRWLNFRQIVRMEDVVYIFCANDLRNLYEVELFKLDTSSGSLTLTNRYQNQPLSLKRRLYRYLGKLRLTYLFMEGYNKFRGRLLQSKALGQVFSDTHLSAATEARQARFRDQYAEGMALDLLSENPSPDTLIWAQRFRILLQWWKDQVEISGARFHIAILTPGERVLLPRLLGETISGYRLVDLNLDRLPAVLSSYSPNFKNDGHWNEIGNLAATTALADYFAGLGSRSLSEGEKDDFLRKKLAEIQSFYRSNGGEPNLDGKGVRWKPLQASTAVREAHP